MNIRNISKIFLLSALVLGTCACSDGDEDYIPPALEEPKPDPVPEPDPEPPFVFHKDGDPYDTYRGLVMAGYQGWFGCPGDGSEITKVENQAWYHYRESEQFRPGVLRNSIDFWPDMSEYEKQYTPGVDGPEGCSSKFFYPNGEAATVFSSFDESTVLLHFKWMQQYGLDGVFMQRFLGEVVNNAQHKNHFDKVLDNAMKGSNQYQRAISVMYDLSGASENMISGMVADAQELMNKYQLKDRSVQKYYLYENGKPLLAIWGVGFNDSNHPGASVIKPYIDQLKEQGWAIMLGCPAYWREGGNDCASGVAHKSLIELIKSCDAFIPWYVGRYDYSNFSGSDWQNRIKKDIDEAKTYENVVYATHVYPGGSDRNMHPNNGIDNPTERTGNRHGGLFYWQQFCLDIQNGARAIYVGMFDEIDEGTAIFKQLNVKDVPSNTYEGPDYWVNYHSNGGYSISDTEKTGVQWSRLASDLNICFQGIDDDLPTDHYLWLTGQGRKLLRGEIQATEGLPVRN